MFVLDRPAHLQNAPLLSNSQHGLRSRSVLKEAVIFGENDCVPVNIITCKWRVAGEPEPTVREMHKRRLISFEVWMWTDR